MLTFLPGLLRPSQEGTLCLHPLEGVPGAFMSDASPVSRALLVLCINQGISASFSLLLSFFFFFLLFFPPLLLSYPRLCTTRFWSIKGPQQVAPEQGHWYTWHFGRSDSGPIEVDGSKELTWLLLRKIRGRGGPSLQDREETTKTPGRRNSNTGHDSSKNLQKMPLSVASTL